MHSEQEVADALEILLEEHQVPQPESVKALIDAYAKERLSVHVRQPNVADYDCLLSSMNDKAVH
jgi:hypothetical protein